MLLSELPEEIRPREKAFSKGIEALSERELLAIILRSGYSGHSVLAIADDLLELADGLAGLGRLSLSDLTSIKGISKVKALELQCTFELVKRCTYEHAKSRDFINNPGDIIYWLRQQIGLRDQESMIVLYLNVKNLIIRAKEIYIGGQSSIAIHPRDIFREAIRLSAAKIVLVHNHPSHDVAPSEADRRATKGICAAGELLEIPVIDHLIISYESYYSFREHQIL